MPFDVIFSCKRIFEIIGSTRSGPSWRGCVTVIRPIRISKHSVAKIAASIFFVLVMTLLPWQKIGGSNFTDLENYYGQVNSSQDYQGFKGVDTLASAVSDEVLWRYITELWIPRSGLGAESVFLFFSALTLLLFAAVVVQNTSIAAIVLLVNPLVIDFALSQLRLAFAISLLILVLGLKHRLFRVILIGLAMLIHTASILFVVMFLVAWKLSQWTQDRVVSRRKVVSLLVVVGFFVSVVTGPLKDVVLGYFHDRRANTPDPVSSILYIAPWAFLWLVQLFERRKYFFSSINCYVVMLLSLIVANLFLGGYSTRFIAASFPFIVVAIMNMREGENMIITLAFLVYTTLQWYYWFSF